MTTELLTTKEIADRLKLDPTAKNTFVQIYVFERKSRLFIFKTLITRRIV